MAPEPEIATNGNKGAITAPKRTRGRPKYEVTDKDRKFVSIMSGFRLPHEDIAEVLSISRNTLERRFRKELATSRMQVRSTILTKFYEALEAASPWAIQWGLRHYLGFREDLMVAIGSDPETAESRGIAVTFCAPNRSHDEPTPPSLDGPRPLTRQEHYSDAAVRYPHRIEGTTGGKSTDWMR